MSLVAALNQNVDINKEVSDMLRKTHVSVCKEQISYMQHQDSKALEVQRNMVDAINNIGRGLRQLISAVPATEPSTLRHSFARRMHQNVEEWHEGFFRTPRRPTW